MIIELSKDEVRICTQLAVERWLAKWDSTDKPNYADGKANGKLEHEVLANIRANVCEWAAAKYYNVSWNVPFYPNDLHPLRKHLPDIGAACEVRSVRTSNSIPFWTKDLYKLIIGTKCLDMDNFTQVYIFGHIEPQKFMMDEFFDESINGWRVPLELFDIYDVSTP